MANSWLRLWHDMPNDPKWRTIARVSGQPISLVQAVYLHLLVDASRNVTRGHVTVTTEDLASALDVTDEAITSIIAAMQGRVMDGESLSGWSTRQPKREDSGDEEGGAKSAAQRKREQREREKEAGNKSNNHQCHDESRKVTTDKDTDTDTDKSKEEANASVGSDADATPPDLPAEPEPQDSIPCPVQKIVEAYHTLMPDNPKVRLLDDARRRTIAARWRQAARADVKPFGYVTSDDGVQAWKTFFEVCSESDFLTGRAPPGHGRDKPFVADLDFLMSPKGFKGCLENKYHRGVE